MSLWGPILIVNHHKEHRDLSRFFFKLPKSIYRWQNQSVLEGMRRKWNLCLGDGTIKGYWVNSSCFIFVANAWRRKYLFKLISVHGQPSQDSDVMAEGIFGAELLTLWQRKIWRTKFVFQILDPCNRGFQRGPIISFPSPDSTHQMDTKPLTHEPVGAHYIQAL